MAVYVVLGLFTQQGADHSKNLSLSPGRDWSGSRGVR
jgi:hypothetical protein